MWVARNTEYGIRGGGFTAGSQGRKHAKDMGEVVIMEEKIRKVLGKFGLLLPAQVRDVIIEIGAEFDRLRADVDQLRSKGK
jgi:hypothetical protein